MFESWIAGSLEFTHWVQSWAGGLAGFFRFFTFLGNADFYILVMPAVLWLMDYGLGLRMGVLLLLNGWVNDIFKLFFAQPRPYWVEPSLPTFGEVGTNFGVPSGHSQVPAAVYGFFASQIKRRWATVAAVLLVFLIGFSRIALGLHFLHDVLIGWTFGLLVLALFLKFEKPVGAWLADCAVPTRLMLVFALTLVMIAGTVLVRPSTRGVVLPPEWAANTAALQPEEPIYPDTLDDTLTYTGALLGLAAGAWWLAGRGGFNPAGSPAQLLLRFGLGALGALLIWRGLGAVFPDGETLLAYALRYLRYGLLGFWIAAGAPWLFMRLGWAKGGSE